jgi:hypothetical protein
MNLETIVGLVAGRLAKQFYQSSPQLLTTDDRYPHTLYGESAVMPTSIVAWCSGGEG